MSNRTRLKIEDVPLADDGELDFSVQPHSDEQVEHYIKNAVKRAEDKNAAFIAECQKYLYARIGVELANSLNLTASVDRSGKSVSFKFSYHGRDYILRCYGTEEHSERLYVYETGQFSRQPELIMDADSFLLELIRIEEGIKSIFHFWTTMGVCGLAFVLPLPLHNSFTLEVYVGFYVIAYILIFVVGKKVLRWF